MADQDKEKSLHTAVGVALGALVTAGATFLYKTEKGQVVRQKFQSHFKQALTTIPEIIEQIKHQASLPPPQPQPTTLKKKVKRPNPGIKKRVFSRSGKPLVK